MYQGFYSPDLSMIAFVHRPQHGYPPDTGVLMVMRVDGTDRRVLHEGPVDRHCSWSPDGSRILFSHQYDLWTAETATGNLVRLTETEFMEYAPAYSPDGTEIAFVGTEHSTAEANVWLADGGSLTRRTMVTTVPARYSDVSWLTGSEPSSVRASTWGMLKVTDLAERTRY
jgi:Tol biopolymer transport system component